jgi:hypothetical protein
MEIPSSNHSVVLLDHSDAELDHLSEQINHQSCSQNQLSILKIRNYEILEENCAKEYQLSQYLTFCRLQGLNTFWDFVTDKKFIL